MSEENFDGNEGDGIKNLRKEHEATKKERDALASELAGFRAEQRKGSVAEILKAKGVPTGFARLYTADEVSEDSVGKWLESISDLLPTQSEPALDPNAEAAARLAAASFGNSALTGTPAPGATNAHLMDPMELQRLMHALPVDELVKLGLLPANPTYGPRR